MTVEQTKLRNDAALLLLALQTAKTHGITSLNQLIALVDLQLSADGRYPGQMAQAAGCSSSAITGITDVLEVLGLVERPIGTDDDRRARRVRITGKGKDTLKKMMP